MRSHRLQSTLQLQRQPHTTPQIACASLSQSQRLRKAVKIIAARERSTTLADCVFSAPTNENSHRTSLAGLTQYTARVYSVFPLSFSLSLPSTSFGCVHAVHREPASCVSRTVFIYILCTVGELSFCLILLSDESYRQIYIYIERERESGMSFVLARSRVRIPHVTRVVSAQRALSAIKFFVLPNSWRSSPLSKKIHRLRRVSPLLFVCVCEVRLRLRLPPLKYTYKYTHIHSATYNTIYSTASDENNPWPRSGC